MVAEDVPNLVGDLRDFTIMQESGSATAAVTTFLRKSIRSRFVRWVHTNPIDEYHFGKVFIWK